MRILTLVLTAFLVFSITACNSSGGNDLSSIGEESSTSSTTVSSSDQSDLSEASGTDETSSSEDASSQVSGTSSSTGSKVSSSVSESSGSVSSESSGSQGVSSEDDIKKNEIVIVSYWDEVPVDEGTFESEKRQYNRYKELAEKYHCVFINRVMTEAEAAAQFEAAHMAGNTIGDIIYFRLEVAKNYQKGRYLYDISQVFDMDVGYFNKGIKEIFTDKKTGAVYAFGEEEIWPYSFLVFNRNIFDRYNVEYPYGYVNNNTWTPEKFLETVKRVTNEKDGIKGFYAITTEPRITNFIYGFDGALCYRDNNGMYKSGLLKPETIEGLEFIRDMNIEHNVTHIPPLGVTWTDHIEQFKAGRVAMTCAYSYVLENLAETMEDDYGIVPYPKKPEVKEWTNMPDYYFVRAMSARIDSDRAKEIGKIYSEYLEPLGTPKELKDMAKEYYEEMCRDIGSVYMLQLIGQSPERIYDVVLAAPSVFYSVLYSDLEAAMRGDKDLISVLEEDDTIFQLELEATNKGAEFDVSRYLDERW